MHRLPATKEAKSAKKGQAVSPRINLAISSRENNDEQQKTDRKKLRIEKDDSESCGEEEEEEVENENQFRIIYPNERNKE